MITALPAAVGRNLAILIVEDEALLAMEIEARLARLGFRVTGKADNGEQAVLLAERERPDLILMDIRLKGIMDGIETAREILRRFDIPVVYLTAHSDPYTLQRAKNVAAFGYVLKPFEEKDLLVAIEMACHRHELERQLRASESKYAATLASIGDGVIATDAAGKITFLNAVAEALTGWNINQARGLEIEDVLSLIDEETRSVTDNPVRRALRHNTVVTLSRPTLLVTKELDFIPIDDSAAPILDSRGDVIGAVVAFRDIRQRRLAENALRMATEERHQSQRLESLGRLAGGVAHDFNNLLTVIIGYSAILLHSKRLDETCQKQVQTILGTGERASKLTRQLLAFGREQMIQAEILALNDVIGQMHERLTRMLGETIEVQLHQDPDLSSIMADASQVEQIIINLATNARDAMPHGGVLTIETGNVNVSEVQIDKRREIRPGEYVRLAIIDTGSGFDEAIEANLFEPFFSTKGRGNGTGLGLATVYGIVKQSKGYIYANSQPGQGATFEVLLPSLGEKIILKPGKTLTEGPSAAKEGETVLLVEDQDQIRGLSAAVLEKFGYTVLQAVDGEDAISVSENFTGIIDIIVTDIIMPRLGGREVAECLRNTRPNTRVLFISGYTEDVQLRAGLERGHIALLQKPFTPFALATKIRSVLDASTSKSPNI